MVLNIEDPNDNVNKKRFSLFALGFRPFFLLAAIIAPAFIAVWMLKLFGMITLSNYYSSTGWHAHEMLFGYTVAVIAGFLLTAAGNWTGVKMISGWRLALLSIVFILGRVAPFISELPYGLIAALDFFFIPLVAVLIAIPVIKVKQWSNIVFVPILLAMALANLTVHLSILNIIDISIVSGSRAMLYLVVLLIVVMGGRVIPFFTERGVEGVITKKWPLVETLSGLSVALLLITDVIYVNTLLVGYSALLAAAIHSVRLAGWYSNKIWQVPLVWILQISYAWLIVGFLLKSLMIFDLSAAIFSYHALTVGGIGIMTLGMMARVSLGHTGREMTLNRWMVLAFVLINVAVVFRVIIPIFMDDYYLQLIQVAGWLWVMAFVIYFLVYTPMWIRPRVDGRPG